MDALLITLVAAFFVIAACIGLMGIGKLLTGKSMFRLGKCGKFPTKKRSEEEGCGKDESCPICGKGSGNNEEEQ